MKRLLIATVLLAGLGGVLYWSNQQETPVDPNAPPTILAVKEADVQHIEVARAGGAPVVMEKDASGNWTITAPENLKADPAAVAALTNAASNIVATRVVDPNVTDLAPYELEPPSVSATFTTAGGKTQRLRIGASTADKSGVYASLDGDTRLFTMPSVNKEAFDKGVNDLRDRHLLTFDPAGVSNVTFSNAGQPTIEFQRTGEFQWDIVKPQPLRADGFQVDELVRLVHDALLEPEADALPFASARPLATVRLKGAEGDMTLEIREIAGQYVARSSALPRDYAVGQDVGIGLTRKLDEFRNAKLFDFGFDDPTKVQIVDTRGSREIEKTGETWVSGGKTMDNIAVQNLIDKLRDLSATAFTAPAITLPEITILVVSKNGQRSETVQLQSQGDAFSAKRADGATLYSVDATAVAQLRDAVAGVREPPPPDKTGNNKK